MRSVWVLFFAVLVFWGCKKDSSEEVPQKGTAPVKEVKKDTVTYSEDPEMHAAVVEARATLSEFYKRLESPQEGDNGFSLKVKFTDENGSEELWLSKIKVDGDYLKGVLSNEPVTVKNLTVGTEYSIKEDDIRDWLYFKNRTMIGNKTIYPMIKTLPPREAYLMKMKLGIK